MCSKSVKTALEESPSNVRVEIGDHHRKAMRGRGTFAFKELGHDWPWEEGIFSPFNPFGKS
jgi:hypothetical protein